MADVRLDFYDLDDEELPDLCMRCGVPSTVRLNKSFRWMPYWARFMPYGVGLAFMKLRRVPIPLCNRHKNHWLIRYIVIFGGLALFLLPLILGAVLFGVSVDNDPHGPLTILGGLMLCFGGVAFVGWLIAAIILGMTQIAAVEITDDTITLKNVSPEFTRAYRAMTRREFDPGVDRAVREKWKRPRDEDDEPRRPRREPPDDKYRRR